MTFDYLLYDNRTLGSYSPDWAIKAATGRLQNDQQARQKFVEYCRHSFDTRLGPLSNFGAALGGIRLNGTAYLLCITLEAKDLHRRPSCAFIGIHCPQATALRDLLMQGDPIFSAKQISETPGPKLVLQGKPLVPDGPLTSVNNRWAGRYQFQPASSPQSAAEILLRQVQKGGRIPSILGITQWNANRSQILSGYDLAYCLSLPAGAEVRQESLEPEPTKKSAFIRGNSSWLLAGIVVVCLSVAAYFILSSRQGRSNTIFSDSNDRPASPERTASPATQPEFDNSSQREAEAFLNQFKKLLDRIESASPNDLQATPEWKTLTNVPVQPDHKNDQGKMIKLLNKDLPDFQETVKKKNFDYYYSGDWMRKHSFSDRANEIRLSAGKIHLPTESCALLRSSLALWTRNSAAGEWCGLVEAFAKTPLPQGRNRQED